MAKTENTALNPPKLIIRIVMLLLAMIPVIPLFAQPDSTTGKADGHEWVDLGLPSGTLWATVNVGANVPTDNGSYFAWGETSTKSEHTWKNYKYLKSGDGWQNATFTKYNCIPGHGVTDNKEELDPVDDAARAKWGGAWRTPNLDEWKELLNNCTWRFTTIGEKKGYEVKSRVNGNSIFLPLSGFSFGRFHTAHTEGHYWSATLAYPKANLYDRLSSTDAWSLFVDARYSSLSFASGRAHGYSIRPVLSKKEAAARSEAASASPKNDAPVTPAKTESKIPASFKIVTPKMVDLGLSVKWGSFNLGASKPEEYGAYFAWGETDWKAEYSWETYKWCEDDGSSLTKYCSNSGYGFKEFTDKKTVLDLDDDAARARLGDKWRIPTEGEYQELLAKCDQEWTLVNGVLGVKFTSKVNGNSIFLPAAGSMTERGGLTGAGTGGSYISSSALRTGDPLKEYCLSLNGHSVLDGSALRRDGCSVRPVFGDPKPGAKGSGEPAVTAEASGMVDLGLSVKWASCNVGAQSPEEFGNYYAWGETEPKSSYSWLNYKWSKEKSMTVFTKYCRNPGYGLDGYSDTKTRLDPDDDAARVNLGEGWRMPTEEEIKELEEKCTWEWMELNKVQGFKVTSLKNGNSIFLPAAGCMMQRGGRDIRFCVYFWSVSMDSDPSARPDRVPCLSKGHARDAILPTRSTGCTVRAVHD